MTGITAREVFVSVGVEICSSSVCLIGLCDPAQTVRLVGLIKCLKYFPVIDIRGMC